MSFTHIAGLFYARKRKNIHEKYKNDDLRMDMWTENPIFA